MKTLLTRCALFGLSLIIASAEAAGVTQIGIYVAKNLGDSPFPLWAEVHYPETTPTGIFILQHGLRETFESRAALIADLKREGFVVAGFDLPGHGSSPNFDPLRQRPVFNQARDGLLPDLGDLAWELYEFSAEVKTQVQAKYQITDLPVILYGHSVGGAIAQDALQLDIATNRPGNRSVFSGSILSSPATGLFTHEKFIAPALSAVGKRFPKAPVFPLWSPLFYARRPAPESQRGSYLDNWFENAWQAVPKKVRLQLYSRDVVRGLVAKRERPSNRGWLHPAGTARAVIERAKERRLLDYPENTDAAYPVLLMHDQGDAITSARASVESLRAMGLGPESTVIFAPGASPHGEVNRGFYNARVAHAAKAMSEGTFGPESVRMDPLPAPRLLDKALRCAGLLSSWLKKAPPYGQL